MKQVCLAFVMACVLGLAATAHAQAPAAADSPAARPAAAAAPITDADLKGIEAPKPEEKAKGDPAGTITGKVGDIPVGDPKKGLTLPDLVNLVGQNQIAINFVWTLVTGFLVMFMQAGFAIVETGLCRAKNANHTMMMNFMVYGVGMLAYWLIGFAIQEGGVGAVANLGGTAPLGANFGLGHGYSDFAGSGVVHAVGGITALAMGIIVGPRIGKYTRQGKPNAIPGHDIVLVLLGCFILAFGWFGFNPGSTLGASGNGSLRIGSIAVNTMLAGCTGSFGALLYMWIRFGKPDASMSGNGLLAGLVAITAPSGFVNTVGALIIGFAAGVLVCLSVESIERVLKTDDPVCATSVHGTCGLWGVLCVGLFADGTSNYGGSWNGVEGSVTGLFYGDPGQFLAQLIGVCTLVGVIFTLSYVLNWFVDFTVGQRVSADVELEGLDLPEMGALGYPEFQLVTPGTGHSVDVGR